MALKGNLATSSLTGILHLLHNDSKTGTLKVKNGGDWVDILIEEGAIVYAMSSILEAGLANLLLGRKIVTLEQLQECLALGKEKQMALGKIVVEKGYFSMDRLKEFLHGQIEEIIYILFLWDSGDFEYRDARLDLSRLAPVKLDIMDVILAASRRIDEMPILEKHIAGSRQLFKISQKIRNKEKIKLVGNEWSILALIDGKRTVDQLIEESKIGKLNVYKALYSLSSSGLIQEVDIHRQPREEVKPEVDHSAIIIGYNNILQIISRNLESELGKQSLVLFDESIPEALPGQRDLFKDFLPNNPASTNICVLQDNIKTIKTIENERLFLAQSFNRFILNILNRVPDILGILPTKKMLEEIESILPFIARHLKGLNLDSNIVDDIKKVMAAIEQQIKEKGKHKSAGILSMFKKK